MGWALWSVDHVSNPTLEVHPHDQSRHFRLAFRSVNLKVVDLAQIGTIPPGVYFLVVKHLLAEGFGAYCIGVKKA
jgi:hypothetical protein